MQRTNIYTTFIHYSETNEVTYNEEPVQSPPSPGGHQEQSHDDGGFPVHDQYEEEAPSEPNVDDFALIREWNAKRREQLNERETEEQSKRAANRDAARKELAAFYEEKTKNRIVKLKANRKHEATMHDERDQASNYSNPFERVVKLVDLGMEAEGKDKSRFQSVLIQLKAKPLSETRA